MVSIIYLVLLLIILYYLIYKNKNQIENFINGNFKLCRPTDCECLKLNRAPDGTCVKYEIARKPLIPEYENKEYAKPYVIRNNLYPKKRKNNILIFIGYKMRNKKTNYENLPRLLKFMEKHEDYIYSEDPVCEHIYDIFHKATELIKNFEKNEANPYLKHIILDTANISQDRPIMRAYKLDIEEYPAIYLYDESSNEMKTFKFNKSDKRCNILQNLMIFIADGDCGLLSYINHMHDPFLGVKFSHNSEDNKWEEAKGRKGYRIITNGTDLCKLIDYKDLPKNFDCKKKNYKLKKPQQLQKP